MSETERLKAETERQYQAQRINELAEYMRDLADKVHESSKANMVGALVYLLGWGTWVASEAIDPASSIGIWGFILGLVYMHFYSEKATGAKAELRGCIKTLELLGMLEKIDRTPRARKRKRVWSKGAEIVKGWAASKRKAQEAYVPA